MRFNVTQIVNKGLCTSCGVCAGSCPKDCISFKYGKERNIPLVDVNKCVKCGLCYDVCPGKASDEDSSRCILSDMEVLRKLL